MRKPGFKGEYTLTHLTWKWKKKHLAMIQDIKENSLARGAVPLPRESVRVRVPLRTRDPRQTPTSPVHTPWTSERSGRTSHVAVHLKVRGDRCGPSEHPKHPGPIHLVHPEQMHCTGGGQVPALVAPASFKASMTSGKTFECRRRDAVAEGGQHGKWLVWIKAGWTDPGSTWLHRSTSPVAFLADLFTCSRLPSRIPLVWVIFHN